MGDVAARHVREMGPLLRRRPLLPVTTSWQTWCVGMVPTNPRQSSRKPCQPTLARASAFV
jgi:hypothetical protein